MRIWQLRDCLSVKLAESNGSRRTAGFLHVLRAKVACSDKWPISDLRVAACLAPNEVNRVYARV